MSPRRTLSAGKTFPSPFVVTKGVPTLVGIFVLLVTTALAAFSPAINALRAYLWSPEAFLQDRPLTAGVVVLILLAAFVMGALRKSPLQMWYGFLEILISAIWFFNAIPQSTLATGPARAAELVACAYVMKRGVDNVFDGFSKWKEYVRPAEKNVFEKVARSE